MLSINWISNNSRNQKEISINNYININSKSIKQDYLNFIRNLKRLKHKNKNIQSHSSFNKKYNLFDVGIIEEKSIYKSENIFEILKILALKKILKKNKKIKIINLNVKSYKAVKLLKKKNNIKIANETNLNIKYLFYNIERLTRINYKQLNVFCHIIKRLVSKIFLKSNLDIKDYTNVIISSTYRTINRNLKDKKEIKKYFFGNLNKKIKDKKNLFLVHYYKQQKNIFFYDNIFKEKSDKKDYFVLFDSLITFRNLFKTSKIFFKFFFNRKNINSIKYKIFSNQELNIYWELISEDWCQNFYGSPAFISINYSLFFNEIFTKSENLKAIYFNFENQNFEKIINNQSYKTKIKTYGITNTSVRFWDLRYFNLKINPKFSPNYIITNKNYPLNSKFLKSNFKSKIIKKDDIFNSTISKKKEIIKNKNKNKKNKILIVGDYISKYNIEFLNMLNHNYKILNNYKFYFKNHPAININLNNFRNLNINNENQKIAECFDQYEKSIFIYSSTAILDAIKFNHEFCLYICDNTIDFSPTNGLKNIKKIFNIDDLLKFIK